MIEANYVVRPVFLCDGWGPKIDHVAPESGGAYHLTPTIVEENDFEKLITPSHLIDEVKTKENFDKVNDAIGDILDVYLDRKPCFSEFQADISWWLGQLLGMEQIMYYMYDRPEWLHKVLAFFRDGILKVHSEATKNGDWKTLSSANQCVPLAKELPEPANVKAEMSDLWGFFASQEYALISPQMHDEFLLQYQLPIMKQYGLIAYGCCEDLTRKIDMLRQVPNLRRIAVSPFADVGKCAEQIERDYVMSYRPSPSLTISSDWDVSAIRKHLKTEIDKCRDNIFDVTLKDVITVKNELWRVKEWVKIVRDIVK